MNGRSFLQLNPEGARLGDAPERHYQIVSTAARQLDLKILCPEYEILVALYEGGPASARELSQSCSWSASAFYAALALLTAQGLINRDPGQHDHREEIYSLTDDVRSLLDQRFAALAEWFGQHLGVSDAKAAFQINEFVRQIESGFRIRFFTHEYEFILFLYEHGAMSPSDLAAMMKSSSSTVFNVIEKLSRRNIVTAEEDPRDRRRKSYRLTDETLRFLNDLHRRLLDFLQKRLREGGGRPSSTA